METVEPTDLALEIQQPDGTWASLDLSGCLTEPLKAALRQAGLFRLVLYGQIGEPKYVPQAGMPEHRPCTRSEATTSLSESERTSTRTPSIRT